MITLSPEDRQTAQFMLQTFREDYQKCQRQLAGGVIGEARHHHITRLVEGYQLVGFLLEAALADKPAASEGAEMPDGRTIPDARCPHCGRDTLALSHTLGQPELLCTGCGWKRYITRSDAEELVFTLSGAGDTPIVEIVQALAAA